MFYRLPRFTGWVAAIILGIVLAIVFWTRTPGYSQQAAHSTQPAQHPRQLWHCGMHPQIVQDHPGDCPICHMALTPFVPADSALSNAAGATVTIDPAVVQNMGVRTAKVIRGTLNKTIRTVGLLTLPEPGLHDVSLKVGGWVDKLDADQEGMHVNKGEPLFEVYSPELQVAEQELISAVKSRKALGPEASDALRQESKNLIDSAKRKLRLWDLDEQDIEAIASADQPPRDVTFRSPATGHIEDKRVVQGSYIQPGMKLLRVANHTKMWLDVQVYEEQIPFVNLGQKVLATVDGIPGKTFAGTITFVYPHLDDMSRTLKVRATLDNPDFELKPGMYATANIATQPVTDAVLCPRDAVIDTGIRQIVFVAEGEGHFSPRLVQLGLSGDGDQVEIDRGLAPGDVVVTSGQFLLDVESRTIEATRKMQLNAPSPSTQARATDATQPSRPLLAPVAK